MEAVDLYQVHWPTTDGTPLDEVWNAMQVLRDEGKARAVGVSNYDVDQLEECWKVGAVGSVQPRLSLLHRRAAADVIPWAKAHDAGVVVYSPLGSGLLTGSFSRERAEALPESDWRSSHRDFCGDALDRNLALVERLRPIAERREVSIGAVAAAWVLAWPGVSGAILGARAPGQIDGWIDAGSLELSAEELTVIAAALEETGAGDDGPTRP
jgi:aryl-alcohol dehydrogenase-like predicted oxidoreductase